MRYGLILNVLGLLLKYIGLMFIIPTVAALFLNEGHFLLIDEPTNHLDTRARTHVANYLKKKKGFILVSHDRRFLDESVDHILSLNRANIEVQSGNFSSWMMNF